MPDPIPETQLAEWERLAAAATEGEWQLPDSESWEIACQGSGFPVGTLLTSDDAVFVCAARTAVPALVAEVRRLRAVMEGIQTWIDEQASDCGTGVSQYYAGYRDCLAGADGVLHRLREEARP